MRENQLSRYGAISKSLPVTTGKTFFLINSSETVASRLLEAYQPDEDGAVRVCTSYASVITQVQNEPGNHSVIVSPQFTTAPTLAEIASLNAANVVVIQAGQNLPDGSYLATKAPVSFATATTIDLFQVNGRIELIEILGSVATTIGAAQSSKFLVLPTVGSSTDLCAAGSVASLAVGGQLAITGTLANAITASVQGAIVTQAARVNVKAGKIQINNTQTSTGNVGFSVRYKAIDPGAFVSAL